MEVFVLVVLLIGFAVLFIKIDQAIRRKRQRAKEHLEAAERKRVAECGEVVLFFANNFGYLARQCISREELEQLIDDGISPDDLGCEIGNRMAAMDGLILGYQPLDDNLEAPVKLTQDFRDRHVYMVGKSGSGKTTLIRNLIYQDLWAGNGVGVIAPEQEMITEEILPYIPEHRIDDVIYFNPADTESPVCFNPLHLDEGEDIDLKVDENISIFKRIVGETGKTRMEEILRQAFYALMEVPGSTLLDIEKLLDRHNAQFKNQVIHQLKDESSIHFWQDVYPQFPKDAHLPIVHRLGRFTKPKPIRNSLCQSHSSLNFRNAMDTGKILLFNLSDGVLGEANSQLLGQLIVAKFQTAVMSRADVPSHQRRKFYLYIDEFQAFTSTANVSYEKILSRARKYHLSLILAHQQTYQIPLELLKEIFGNVSTMVSFNVSRDDAVKLSKEMIAEYNGELYNIPPEEILRLRVGETYCKIGQQSVFMKTYPAFDRPDDEYSKLIIERSRTNYGIPAKREAEKLTNVTEEKAKQIEDIDPSQVF